MNILDFKEMNICFEWIFCIFIKLIIVWISILVLVRPRQKQSSPKVSNSSEMIQGSLVGPISVHFSGLLPKVGPQEGSAAIFWLYFGILNNSPHFFEWMIVLNVLDSIEWIFFLMNIPDFVLNSSLNWIIFLWMKKWIFKTDLPGLIRHKHVPLRPNFRIPLGNQ